MRSRKGRERREKISVIGVRGILVSGDPVVDHDVILTTYRLPAPRPLMSKIKMVVKTAELVLADGKRLATPTISIGLTG